MVTQERVAIAILNFNGRHWLEKFLPSVMASTYNNKEIVVIDNCSTDDSVEWLRKFHPQVTLVQNHTNGGYSQGYNDGLKKIQADYYVLLNSDIEVEPGWIEPVIRLMQTDSSIAACQPKIRMFDQKELFEYAGASGGFMDQWGYMYCRGRIFDHLETDLGQYNDAREVFWATGACLFVKAVLYHEIGGLYEPLFAHMEEIDFCWRLRNLGYKIYVCPESTVFHVGGGTLPKTNARKTYLNFRNNLIIMYRNMGQMEKLFKIPIRFGLDFLSLLFFLKKKEYKNAAAVSRAHRQFLKHIWRWHKEKPQGPKLFDLSGKTKISVIWQYFVRGKRTYREIHP